MGNTQNSAIVEAKIDNQESNENSQQAESNPNSHKIDYVINSFLHRILDIEDCATQYITAASKSHHSKAEMLKKQITDSQNILQHEEDKNKRLLAMKSLRKTLRDVERHNSSSLTKTLEKSLFINLFAAFDKFIGDIVAALYQENPQLYKNLNREIKLSEAISYESMDDLRQAVLEKEIETIRRKNYVEQFKELESKFSITLTKFEGWANFIESAQRRNLFTHCDGVVSKQYLDACQEVGYKPKIQKAVGEQLEIGAPYFFKSCMLIADVAVMLGHTLWRKVLPEKLDEADSHISRLIFDYLHMENWAKAISLSKFALKLPKISSEQNERIFTVNYAIALNAIEQEQASKNVLDKKDWSATSYDFKLAYAILTRNYQEAKDIMIRIGVEGDIISELSYHDWPLFRDFRDSEEFLSGYEKVYGYQYSYKLSEIAEDKKAEVDEAVDSILDVAEDTSIVDIIH